MTSPKKTLHLPSIGGSPPPAAMIGILGGSFNPAHEGHVHISLEAKRALGLDAVWWLVSPHNPLKKKEDLYDYDVRLAKARAMAARYPFIKVTNLEAQLGTRYTYDTLKTLKKRFPRVQFVWLMGADNLAGFHRWQHWEQIFALCPILVLDRAPYSYNSLKSKASIRFAASRLPERALRRLATSALPAWGYLHMRRHSASATAIRKMLANP